MPPIPFASRVRYSMDERQRLLEVKNLQTYFFLDEGVVRAVNDVSFDIDRGRTLGVLGESGCGKSVTGFSILRLVRPPGKIAGGEILYHQVQPGEDRVDPRI